MEKEIGITIYELECLIGLGVFSALALSFLAYFNQNQRVVVMDGIRTKGDVARGVSELARKTKQQLEKDHPDMTQEKLKDWYMHEYVHGNVHRDQNMDSPPGAFGFRRKRGKIDALFYGHYSGTKEKDLKTLITPLYDRRTKLIESKDDINSYNKILHRRK